jgi:hypothetical protein
VGQHRPASISRASCAAEGHDLVLPLVRRRVSSSGRRKRAPWADRR